MTFKLKLDFDAGQLCKMNFDIKNNEYLGGLIVENPKEFSTEEGRKTMDSNHERETQFNI